MPAPLQRLIFCGKMLSDGQTLEAAGVKANNCVHLFARPAHAQMPASSSTGTGRSTALMAKASTVRGQLDVDMWLTQKTRAVGPVLLAENPC